MKNLCHATRATCAALLLWVPFQPSAHAAEASSPSTVDPVPDFQLVDVNPNSPRNTTTVSPRDYRLQISAYYFGAAG